MRQLLVRCYPARWRARYGDEFAAVLAERPLGPFDVADVLLGAIDAHLHLRGLDAASNHRGGVPMSLRIGGSAAIVGGVSWILALGGSALAGSDVASSVLWSTLLVLATAALLAALVGLSAFQARRFPRLTWAAFILPAAGAAASVVGLVATAVVGDEPFVAGMTPWSVWLVGTTGLIAGSALFALATWRSGTFSRGAVLLLFLGSLTIVPIVAITSNGSEAGISQLVLVALVGLFGASWVWLGISALRVDGARFSPTSAASIPGASA